MSKVDWSKAPDDAEFYAKGSFRRMTAGKPAFWNETRSMWDYGTFDFLYLKRSDDFELRPEKKTDAGERKREWFVDKDLLKASIIADALRGSDSEKILTSLLNNRNNEKMKATITNKSNSTLHVHEDKGAINITLLPDEDAKRQDGSKYHRQIIGFCGTMVEVDVYRVLDAFKTESSAIDHAIKKMLCTGIRGHKDFLTDIDNAIESLQEARLLHLQKQEIDKA